MIETVQDRTLTPGVKALIGELVERFERRRLELIAQREQRRAVLAAGGVDVLPDTAHVRATEWRIDPVPTA
ncbi:MAG TPA: hypothetical protein VKG92_07815, partial [Flavobacteriales bacterium]|nr:hypothetical protein [Flavobacteriales bacterium]